jgi:hypothetical protein
MASSGGSCLSISGGSIVRYGSVIFAASLIHISTATQGVAQAVGNYTISGGAVYHWSVTYGSSVLTPNISITFSGSNTFSSSFLQMDAVGVIQAFGITFTGSFTGKRYQINSNSVCYVNGAATTYFPGTVAGATATGGQYV